jgi:hypothetical protein
MTKNGIEMNRKRLSFELERTEVSIYKASKISNKQIKLETIEKIM